ncbi:MAG: hypothetical protein HC786_12045 [Richelia sp. CSU_2_1]|nr:hypothetical protein [Richelia sp. CSU_2_1]
MKVFSVGGRSNNFCIAPKQQYGLFRLSYFLNHCIVNRHQQTFFRNPIDCTL